MQIRMSSFDKMSVKSVGRNVASSVASWVYSMCLLYFGEEEGRYSSIMVTSQAIWVECEGWVIGLFYLSLWKTPDPRDDDLR